MKQLIVSSLISLTLLNSGISYSTNTTNVSDNGTTELKQIISNSNYNPRQLDLGISKISSNLEKIQQTENKKIEDQKKLEEENRLREEQRQQQIAEEKKQKADELARENALAKLSVPAQAPVVQQPTIVPSGDIQAYAKNRVCEVFGCDQWDAYYFIIEKESRWNYKAINKSSGAGGLCQALPFNKMATKGDDYTTNPSTQTEWCISYILGRYKNPAGAKAFWVANRWF